MKKIKAKTNKIYAYILYCIGQKPYTSTFIDEDTITMGYGKLDGIGEFEYPLSNRIVKKTFGTTSWRIVIENYI